MTTNIQLLRSSVSSKRPSPATLLEGQVAVNINAGEPGLYFKLTDGNLTKVGPVAVSASATPPNSAPAGSSGNAVGEQWLDSRANFSSPVLKVFDGAAWQPGSGFTVNDTSGDFSLGKMLTVRTLVADGTGADSYVQVPSGPTSDQTAIGGSAGMIRFNNTDNEFVGHDGTEWIPLAGVTGGDGEFDNLLVKGNLTVLGNTILGDNCSEDTLTVQSTTYLTCNTTIGNAGTTTTVLDSPTESKYNISLLENKEIRLYTGATTSDYIGLRSPSVLSTTTTYTLPPADGISGQVLSTSGTGQLSWFTIPSSSTVGDGIIAFTAGDGLESTGDNATANQTADTEKTFAVKAADLTINVSSAGIKVDLDNLLIDENNLANCSTSTSNGKWCFNSTMLPDTDNAYDIGSPTARIANIYTGDLHLANERGDWTVIEEEEYLSLRNNKTGSVFKIMMEKVS